MSQTTIPRLESPDCQPDMDSVNIWGVAGNNVLAYLHPKGTPRLKPVLNSTSQVSAPASTVADGQSAAYEENHSRGCPPTTHFQPKRSRAVPDRSPRSEMLKVCENADDETVACVRPISRQGRMPVRISKICLASAGKERDV